MTTTIKPKFNVTIPAFEGVYWKTLRSELEQAENAKDFAYQTFYTSRMADVFFENDPEQLKACCEFVSNVLIAHPFTSSKALLVSFWSSIIQKDSLPIEVKSAIPVSIYLELPAKKTSVVYKNLLPSTSAELAAVRKLAAAFPKETPLAILLTNYSSK